jgi:hypothetical protein
MLHSILLKGHKIKLIYFKIDLCIFYSVFCLDSSSFAEEKIISEDEDNSLILLDVEVESARIIPETYFPGTAVKEKIKPARRQVFENIRKRELFFAEVVGRGALKGPDEINRQMEDINRFSTVKNLKIFSKRPA